MQKQSPKILDFSNKSQLGAFGEFIYKRYCESLGFEIERTNYCHTDFFLKAKDASEPQYVDVKASLRDKPKYQGKRYHKDIAYELMLFLENEILLSPDKNSPLYDKGRHSLGLVSVWLAEWEKNTEIISKRESRLDGSDLNSLKDLFSKIDCPRVRIVERGDASAKRWTGTVDNLPGSPNIVSQNDVTVFIEFGCEDFVEKVSRVYLIWHHLLNEKKIKMSKPNSRQEKKGVAEVIDLKEFIEEYPHLVFNNLEDLKSYIKNSMNQ
jgi:hypothetical protein